MDHHHDSRRSLRIAAERRAIIERAFMTLHDPKLRFALFDGELAQGKDEQDVAQFANRYGVEYPIALDGTGQVARDYRLYPIPVSYFIDRSGKVRYIRIGQLTTADVEELFRCLLYELSAVSSQLVLSTDS